MAKSSRAESLLSIIKSAEKKRYGVLIVELAGERALSSSLYASTGSMRCSCLKLHSRLRLGVECELFG